MTPKQPDPESSENKYPKGLLWWWVVIVFAITAWYLLSYQPATSAVATIPYSLLLTEVRAGNVVAVDIVGDRISGTLAQPRVLAQLVASPALSQTKATRDKTDTAPFTQFKTSFPEAIGDPRFLPLLEKHGVEVSVTSPNLGILSLVLQAAPFVLLIVLVWWMGRQVTQGQSGAYNFGRSRARRYSADCPEVTFDDVAGADEAKTDLQEVVDFLSHPEKYHDIGARIPRGVLLVGPPGTGKTLLGRAVAGEAGVPFFSLSGSEFVEMFVGVGASRVRDLFNQAKAAAPAIVFIDELDAVGRRRGAGMGTVNDEREQTLNQLLVEMDGFDTRQEVIILAATNRPDVLDPALLRPGRFDRHVTVELPDQKGREGILRIHTKKMHLAPEVDLRILARLTTGFSGADLANLANEAALIAARRNLPLIAMPEFEEAQDKVLLGGTRSLLLSQEQRRVVAYHEAGHALVAWLTPPADPVRKVTIIPRGRALGVTAQLPAEDHYNYSRTYLMARLAVMLGGRSAEELVIGDVTTGAENDLVEATRLARRMVTRWGMGGLGLVAFQTDDENPFLGYSLTQGQPYSDTTASLIDQEVQQLLAERHRVVQHQLLDAQKQLEALAQALLREETIDQDKIAEILGSRPAVIENDQEPALPWSEVSLPTTGNGARKIAVLQP
jgi:cell division protease FtsH